MGDYPRLASFGLDTERFCARILKMTPNPLENKMSHPDPLYDIDNAYDEDTYYDEDCYVEDDYYDDSMDGDHESAFGSCGWGVDEQYNIDYDYGEDW